MNKNLIWIILGAVAVWYVFFRNKNQSNYKGAIAAKGYSGCWCKGGYYDPECACDSFGTRAAGTYLGGRECSPSDCPKGTRCNPKVGCVPVSR